MKDNASKYDLAFQLQLDEKSALHWWQKLTF